MRRLIILVMVVALSLAKPELYREKEDFQYSRSSSDEGTKAGFYGAQRGNMGGNYERAHNMDTLAQHQMGGLVSQVHGELGDAAKAKTGNVFAASNSRGLYGSGHYDLRKVQGRNFQEGVSYEDSSAESSAHGHSAASHNSAYTTNIKNSRYHAGQTGQYSAIADNADNLYSENYAKNYDTRSGYDSQTGYQAQSSANQYLANEHGSNIKTRLISAKPMRVVVRPGGTVIVPVAAQTYESTHRQTGSLYDQNSFNSEAEDINSIGNTHSFVNPTGKAKHYESSYSYQKEWEKQNTKPVAVPLGIQTENPLAREVYMSGGLDSESHLNQASGYQATHASHNSYNRKSSEAQSGYNAHQYGSNSNAYKQGSEIEKANQDALISTLGENKPKSYQSSYSYHKSWEKQGDPYVIVPSSSNLNNQQTERLTDTSYTSNQYGSQNRNGYQKLSQINEDCDCEENQGHIRVVRSYGQEWNQQSQNLEDLGQQTENLEDLGQQTQNQWENMEDLGQQAQQQWGNLKSFGQQNQNQWRQNLGQETQSQWSNLNQQTQNQWGDLQDLGQQSQNQWGNLNDLGQQPQVNEDLEQQLQSSWTSIQQNTGQQAEINWNTEQQIQGSWTFDTTPKENTLKKTDSSTIEPNHLHTNKNLEVSISNVDKKGWELTQNTQSLNTLNNQNEQQHHWNFHPKHSSNQNDGHWYTNNQKTQERNEWHNSDDSFDSGYNKHAPKPLYSLWDKINNLDRDSTSFNKSTESRQRWWIGHAIQNGGNSNNNSILTESTTQVKITTEKNQVESGSWKPVDIGRGDIGSEDTFIIQTTEKINTANVEQTFTENKKYKTPEEIETLSLMKPSKPSITDSNDDEEINKLLTVLSLSYSRENVDNHKSTTTKYARELPNNVRSDKTKTKPQVQEILNNKNDTQNLELQSKNILKINSVETFSTQQNENLDQQTTWNQDLNKFNIQNKEQVEQTVDFGQQTDKIYQQSSWIPDSAQIGQEPTMEFDHHQQNNNLEQPRQSWVGKLEIPVEKVEVTEQQLQDFTQQNENLEQQFESVDQLENFYQPQKENHLQQKLTDFTQQNKNLNQNVEHETQNFEQLNNNHLPTITWGQTFEGREGREHRTENNKAEKNKQGKNQDDHELQETNNWGQQTDDLTKQTQENWKDLTQQEQRNFWEPQQTNDNKQKLALPEQQVLEEPVIPRKMADVEIISPERTTVKPGFWKAVGSKFVNAKDKVASWFQRST